MLRTTVLFTLTLLSISLSAQTFSLILDPVEGDETIFHNNYIVDLVVADDKVIVSGQHSCDQSLESGNLNFCASLSSFDLDGKFNNSILIDSFFNALPGGLLAVDKRIFTANFKQGDSFLGRSLYIQEYDPYLELVNQIKIPNRSDGIPNTDGLKFIGGNYYVYSSFVYQSGPTKGFIQKLDLDFNLLWDKQYVHGLFSNGCDKLQETNDGNLVFVHEYADAGAGPDRNDGIQIVKLNSDGIKIDSLEIEDAGPVVALLSDTSGIVYTYTIKHPTIENSILEASYGRINKYSSNLDTLLWSLKLPYNGLINSREYTIFDFKLAKNGDVLACGGVFDNSLDGGTGTANFSVNAFIARISKAGAIKWLHLYKSPNKNKLMPTEEFGKYHHSWLARLAELEDGRIVAAGTSRVTPRQESIVSGTTDPWSEFLIVCVNGETGCIDEEECDEVIILDGENKPRDNYLPVINSGQTWMTEQTDENGVSEIVSATYFKDTTIFFLFNNYLQRIEESVQTSSTMTTGHFRELGGRIYQQKENSYKERLIFDIHLQPGEVIEVERENGFMELIAIMADTIVYEDAIPRKRIFLKCLSEQSQTDPIIWVEGIGELNNDNSCGLDIPHSRILCVRDASGNSVYSLEDEGCQEILGCLDREFSVGDKWIYERFKNFQPAGFIEYSIVEETEWQGEQAMVIEPGFLNSKDYMIQEDDRVYFWDYSLGEYQLNYEFDNDSVYYVRFFNSNTNGPDSTAVFIDSVKTIQYNGQDVQVQYCKSEFGVSPSINLFEVIKGVGKRSQGLRLPIALIIDCFGECVGNIRCFESTDCNIQFEDYPCDTVFITSTKQMLGDPDFHIYPNPVEDKLYLEKTDQNWEYKIINLQGKEILQGRYQEYIEVSQLPSGIYFLQLSNNAELYKAVKFVKR